MAIVIKGLRVKKKEENNQVEKEILKGVDLEVRDGEIVVLMGRNGSGKSTLVQAIAGNEDYKVEGQIILDNKNVNNLSALERAKLGLGVVFQNSPHLEGVKVGSMLYMIYKSKHASKSKDKNNRKATLKEFMEYITPILKEVGLEKEVLNKPLDATLSGGERKRVELAMLLLLEPKNIILDEVDSGMDIEGMGMLKKLICNWKKQGKSLLVITHYPNLVEEIKEEIKRGYLLGDGKIIKEHKDIRQMVLQVRERGFDE